MRKNDVLPGLKSGVSVFLARFSYHPQAKARGFFARNNITYDKKKDILYIFLRKGIEDRFEDLSGDITVEYDVKNRPIGIEIYNASKVIPRRDFPKSL